MKRLTAFASTLTLALLAAIPSAGMLSAALDAIRRGSSSYNTLTREVGTADISFDQPRIGQV